MIEKFACQKCGSCCMGLFVSEFGLLAGLSLTEEETKMFEPNQVAPYMAIGDEKPLTVVLYQLVLSDCPHLNQKNQCEIYESRPLICRAFPVHPRLDRESISPRCPQIGKHFTGVGTMCPFFIDDNEIEEAVSQINLNALILKQKCEREHLKFWIFDLVAKQWIIQE